MLAKLEEPIAAPTIINSDDKINIKPDASAFYNRGNTKYDSKDYEGAIADYDEAIRLNPENHAAIDRRDFAKRKLGNSFAHAFLQKDPSAEPEEKHYGCSNQ